MTQHVAKFKKDLEVVQRERLDERQHMEDLLDSTLNRAKTLEEEVNALKQGLSDATRRADELEISCRCSICLYEKVGVIFMPCQHACCCMICWKTWSNKYMALLLHAPSAASQQWL